MTVDELFDFYRRDFTIGRRSPNMKWETSPIRHLAEHLHRMDQLTREEHLELIGDIHPELIRKVHNIWAINGIKHKGLYDQLQGLSPSNINLTEWTGSRTYPTTKLVRPVGPYLHPARRTYGITHDEMFDLYRNDRTRGRHSREWDKSPLAHLSNSLNRMRQLSPKMFILKIGDINPALIERVQKLWETPCPHRSWKMQLFDELQGRLPPTHHLTHWDEPRTYPK
tara:strand:- start:610 stop:1284 length:675 start_codon:yes stop_codon:yes gene_type:complete